MPQAPGRGFDVLRDQVAGGHQDAVRSAKEAVGDFVDSLGPGDRVSLAPTSGGAWWHVRNARDRQHLLSALRRLQGLRPRDFSVERISDYEAMRVALYRDPEVAAALARRYNGYGITLPGADTTAGVLPGVPMSARHELFRDPLPMIIRARAAEIYQNALSRKRATYGVLQRVAVALEAARGRKSILFVSEGFVQEPVFPRSIARRENWRCGCRKR